MKLSTPTKSSFLSKLSTPMLVIAIIAFGVMIASFFMVTKPTSKRIRPPVSSPTVITQIAQKEDAELFVSALGTVKAAQETIIRSRVSGQVEKLGANFEPGGIVKKDALLVQLDSDDYQNSLAMKESTMAQAQANYTLEMGQQRVARSELEQLEKLMPQNAKNTSLALREPQLAQAKAELEAAKSDVNQAKLNLERTKITAPYNAIILMRNVSLGSQASTSDTLATIAGTDEYHIEAAIPLDKLQALGISVFDGAKVNIFTATENMRQGSVLHSIASLDETTRMGRLLVSVLDPLGLERDLPHLLLGDQVRVELQAGILPDTFTIPRVALRSNDTVWVAVPTTQDSVDTQDQSLMPDKSPMPDKKPLQGPNYSLDIRHVVVAWKDTQYVIVSKGLEQGEQIITSPLGAPIQGMPVRIAPPQSNKQDASQKAKPKGK